MPTIEPNCYNCKNLIEKEKQNSPCGIIIFFGCKIIESITIMNPESVICTGFSKK